MSLRRPPPRPSASLARSQSGVSTPIQGRRCYPTPNELLLALQCPCSPGEPPPPPSPLLAKPPSGPHRWSRIAVVGRCAAPSQPPPLSKLGAPDAYGAERAHRRRLHQPSALAWVAFAHGTTLRGCPPSCKPQDCIVLRVAGTWHLRGPRRYRAMVRTPPLTDAPHRAQRSRCGPMRSARGRRGARRDTRSRWRPP